MKPVLYLLVFAIATSFMVVPEKPMPLAYDCSDEIISSVPYEGMEGKYYRMIKINRSQNRFKAKYFAFRENGKTVYERYNEWKTGRNILLISSGTYISREQPTPDGLTIDNGTVVNRSVSNSFDGLVIVYATGGIAVTDISEQAVKINCNGTEKSYNVNDYMDREDFIACAQKSEATIFQTHLLVFKDALKISPPRAGTSSANRASRRFLAACYQGKTLYHVIVHIEPALTLYEATLAAQNFLKDLKEMDSITYMVNLDTGMQNVFELRDCRGGVRRDIEGTVSPQQATNLLVYYYE